MTSIPTSLPRDGQGISPTSTGRIRRSQHGVFPDRLARRVNRIWARVLAELRAEPPAAAEPGSVLPTEHRRPIEQEAKVADPARVERLRQRTGQLVARELAAQRQAAKRGEAARVAELGAHDRKAAQERAAAKAGILQSDLGPDGAAMQARPTCHAGIPGSDTVAMADHDPLPLMELTDREDEAAGWLRYYFCGARPELAMPQGWRSGGRGGAPELTGDQQAAAATAWRNYCDWMALIRRDCGDQAEAAVQAVVIHRQLHPAIALVPPALDYLAGHMGIR